MTAREDKPLRLYRVIIEHEFPVLARSPDEARAAADKEIEALGCASECARARLSADEGYQRPAGWENNSEDYPVHTERGDKRRLSWSDGVGPSPHFGGDRGVE